MKYKLTFDSVIILYKTLAHFPALLDTFISLNCCQLMRINYSFCPNIVHYRTLPCFPVPFRNPVPFCGPIPFRLPVPPHVPNSVPYSGSVPRSRFHSVFRFCSCDLRVLCEMPEKSLCCLLCNPSSFLLFPNINMLCSLITKY